MEIYLIRHGETGGNVAHRHQAEDTELTARGVEQAKAVAVLMTEYEPTHLVCSPLVRSIQTAREIAKTTDLTPTITETVTELRRASYMYGHFHKSFFSMIFYARWFFGHTTDGESYASVRQRIVDAKAFFATFPEDARIAVVSHSVFINLFLAHMCYDERMTLLQAVKTFTRVLTIKNTEVIPLVFDPKAHPDTCGWLRNG